MADVLPEFEISDKKGTSVAYSGTVGVSWTAIPTVAGNNIQEFSIEADVDNAVTNILYVSLDGGTTTAAELYPTGTYYQLIKGSQTQVHIKGFAASCGYRAVINYEAPV